MLEIQQVKKRVLRPHIQTVPEHTYRALHHLREDLMINLSEKKIQFYFKTNSVLRKLVMLVLISINTLLPKAESVHSENSQQSSSEKY